MCSIQNFSNYKDTSNILSTQTNTGGHLYFFVIAYTIRVTFKNLWPFPFTNMQDWGDSLRSIAPYFQYHVICAVTTEMLFFEPSDITCLVYLPCNWLFYLLSALPNPYLLNSLWIHVQKDFWIQTLTKWISIKY